MTRIPKKLRNEMALDPFYHDCALSEDGQCIVERKIEWHHVLIFAGRQVQSKAFIVPACDGYHHRFATRHDIAQRFLKVSLARATDDELRSMSKAIDYIKMRDAICGVDKPVHKGRETAGIRY